jgi:hypothetical protein
LDAFYIPIVLLVISAIGYGISAWTLMGDKESFDISMGYKSRDPKVTIIHGRNSGLENGAFDSKNA